jgi:hypothetical protein
MPAPTLRVVLTKRSEATPTANGVGCVPDKRGGRD